MVQRSINGRKWQLGQNIPIVTEQNEDGLERTSCLDLGVWQLTFQYPRIMLGNEVLNIYCQRICTLKQYNSTTPTRNPDVLEQVYCAFQKLNLNFIVSWNQVRAHFSSCRVCFLIFSLLSLLEYTLDAKSTAMKFLTWI